jgi:hypothetical protein
MLGHPVMYFGNAFAKEQCAYFNYSFGEPCVKAFLSGEEVHKSSIYSTKKLPFE